MLFFGDYTINLQSLSKALHPKVEANISIPAKNEQETLLPFQRTLHERLLALLGYFV